MCQLKRYIFAFNVVIKVVSAAIKNFWYFCKIPHAILLLNIKAINGGFM